MTKTSRGIYLFILISSLSFGLYVVIKELNSNITFFYTPTEIARLSSIPNDSVKIGGLVKPGSINKKNAKTLSFIITDCSEEITVTYKGNISPLFREEQGIVALGTLTSKSSMDAINLLTKHDESYRPKTSPTPDKKNFCNFQNTKK